MRLTTTILCLLMLAFATPIAAEEIQPGVQYTGPKKLEITSIGVSFQLPKGWTGTLPQGQGSFVVGQAGSDGYIFLVAEQATIAQARTEMSQPVPIDQVVMQPKGQATVKGSTITNSYNVVGGATELGGEAIAKVGKTGMGVMALAVATPAELPKFTKAAQQIMKSVVIAAPKKPKAPKMVKGGYWTKEFAGKRVVRFFTGSGYSEKQQYVMCGDGRFVYDFSGGGFSMDGASGAFQSNNAGRWAATGSAAGGVLTLTYNDGRTSTFQLAQVDGKLMIDGKRWLREAVQCP